jgi:hypothetical protein
MSALSSHGSVTVPESHRVPNIVLFEQDIPQNPAAERFVLAPNSDIGARPSSGVKNSAPTLWVFGERLAVEGKILLWSSQGAK